MQQLVLYYKPEVDKYIIEMVADKHDASCHIVRVIERKESWTDETFLDMANAKFEEELIVLRAYRGHVNMKCIKTAFI